MQVKTPDIPSETEVTQRSKTYDGRKEPSTRKRGKASGRHDGEKHGKKVSVLGDRLRLRKTERESKNF